MADISMWIHGNSMEIEYPDRLESFRRSAFYMQVDGKPGTSNWFHYPIASPVIVLNQNTKLAAVFLRFKTGSTDAYIKDVHLFDGEKKIAEFNDVNLSPQSFETKRFDPPLTTLDYGLGVSMHVEFGTGSKSHVMEFSAAGANFSGLELTEVEMPDSSAKRDVNKKKKTNKRR